MRYNKRLVRKMHKIVKDAKAHIFAGIFYRKMVNNYENLGYEYFIGG